MSALDALREMRGLFDADGNLFCSGDHQLEVIARADAALRARSSAPEAREGEREQPKLTVWYGEMPESNGKRNWTAILGRKDAEGFDFHTDGFCFHRSEYPDRARYEADEMRWIIGELAEQPNILAYDHKLHSGYITPSSAAPSADKLRIAVEALEKAKDLDVSLLHDGYDGGAGGGNYVYADVVRTDELFPLLDQALADLKAEGA